MFIASIKTPEGKVVESRFIKDEILAAQEYDKLARRYYPSKPGMLNFPNKNEKARLGRERRPLTVKPKVQGKEGRSNIEKLLSQEMKKKNPDKNRLRKLGQQIDDS